MVLQSRHAYPPSDAPRAVFEGDLSVFALVDVVQLVCAIHGVHRVVVMAEDREVGRMLVAAAEVVSAQSAYQEGDEAFVELSRRTFGKVVAFPTTYEDEADLPRLSRSWQELALEAARLEDEERRDSTVEGLVAVVAEQAPVTVARPPASATEPETPRQLPPPSSPASLAPAELSFAELYREALSAYVRRDYAAALAGFDQCLVLRPDDRAVRHNLERLAKFRRQP